MKKEEISHCLCGGTAKVKNKDNMVWVECKRCGKRSEAYPTDGREYAIEDWQELNRR